MKSKKIWVLIFLYVAFIYSTLPLMNSFILSLYRLLGKEKLSLSVNIFFVIISVTALIFLTKNLKGKNNWKVLFIFLIFAFLFILAFNCELPAERLHFLEYALVRGN